MYKNHRGTAICLAAAMLALTACSQASSGGRSGAETTKAAETETTAETTKAPETTKAESSEAPAETTAAETTEAEEESYPYDYTDPSFLDNADYYEHTPMAGITGVKADGSYFNLKSDVYGYGVLQGSCTDGTYAYMFLQNKRAKMVNKEFVSMDLLYKVDMSTWEVAAVSEPLEVDHANSVTYNSKTGQLVVCNGSPNQELISFVDPETLTVLDKITYPRKINGISYNESRDQYVIRASSAQDIFMIADADFQELSYFEGVDTGLSLQNIDSDDDYIYILNTGVSKNPGVEIVTVYDWDGNYVTAYRLDSMLENEGMFHVGDTYYVTFYNGGGSGGRVYEVELDPQFLTYIGNK